MVAAALLTSLALPATAALAAQGNVTLVGPLNYRAVSDDGTKVFIETTEALVAADTDGTKRDVYVVFDSGVPRLVSIGPAGASALDVTFVDASADGSRVVFSTLESLVPEDTDAAGDWYVRDDAGPARLLAPAGTLRHASHDGQLLVLETAESLGPEDGDATSDLYQVGDAGAELVSVGASGQNVAQSTFAGASDDGSRVWFRTTEPVAAEDDDLSWADIYEHTGGQTRLLSDWPSSAGGLAHVRLDGASADGTRVLVTTAGAVTPDDTDNAQDIYEVTAGGVTLVSTGPADGPGGPGANFMRMSPDGTKVYFQTTEALVPGHAGGLYERAGGVTTWLGKVRFDSFLIVSGDSSTTWFISEDPLVPEDTDSSDDLYRRSGGVMSLQTDPFIGTPHLRAVSHDGSRLFFESVNQLDALDTDGDEDVYALKDGVVYLMSTGPNSWPAAPVVFQPIAATPDGEHLFFQTFDRLTVDDGDTEADVYEARFPDTSGFPRPKGAAPLRLSLVPAFERCTAPNRLHGPGLVFGSCAPPVRVPGRLTVGTPDANGEAANAVGSVRLATLPGNPATPQDEADVRIQFQDLDVREAGDLFDYEGELELSLAVRVTDRDALDGPAVPVTQEDAGLSVIVPCTATADVTIGATCEVDTTADAVVPGVASEGRRAIWAHEAVQVYDGGADGDAQTIADNELFQVQGIFVP